jgi:hypothetical protein
VAVERLHRLKGRHLQVLLNADSARAQFSAPSG